MLSRGLLWSEPTKGREPADYRFFATATGSPYSVARRFREVAKPGKKDIPQERSRKFKPYIRLQTAAGAPAGFKGRRQNEAPLSKGKKQKAEMIAPR